MSQQASISNISPLAPTDTFVRRHLGPSDDEISAMLKTLKLSSLDQLIAETVPSSIHFEGPLELEGLDDSNRQLGEHELLQRLHRMASQNEIYRSFQGMGYYDCIVPPVIQRNILENPGWYTAYTPYQAEISQGRLEALLTYQTMISDLTGLPMSNASLLDEGTAAAEAMSMAWSIGKRKRDVFVASADCHPQTLAVLETRTAALDIELRVQDLGEVDFAGDEIFGVLLQYPVSDGRIVDYSKVIEQAHAAEALVIMASDLLALTLLRSPGELGADIAVGSAQRFGVPMGFGGPHAAFLATSDAYKRQMPGRVIGVSKDRHGAPAYRMAMQTREQHIRREKATSNICTAQVLLAVMAGMYAVYHGPEGLRRIARRVHALTCGLAKGLRHLGYDLGDAPFFDTLRVSLGRGSAADLLAAAERHRFNLRAVDAHTVGLSLDEATSEAQVDELLATFDVDGKGVPAVAELCQGIDGNVDQGLARHDEILEHPVFNSYHTEHEMLRYLHRLESRDLSLNTSMIALGSCTMKLNATSEMLPVTWPEFGNLHPFAPSQQTAGYRELFRTLESWLCSITGFHGMSLQPNAGSQGEYTGLMVIRQYHRSRGDSQRNICLIPVSAHGTNPASAVLAGMKVVVVACDDQGNVDVDDLRAKAEQSSDSLAALMITYPSTHGVFESSIREICDIIHQHGGQIYLDGANMNAQVGLCRLGDFGADVCHLNLHKTFCIPHGGGGPGMGPVGTVEHLTPFLPGHPVIEVGGSEAIGAVAAAPWGSASILPISWVYIALMGPRGLLKASQVAILNANYMAQRLEGAYEILYRGDQGRVAHEFILDLRPFKAEAGIEAEDVAKRLMDYGFHAPTMSFPVPGTLMIEPTESESLAELDRFCEAMLSIREEIREVADGRLDKDDNPLSNAPHTATEVTDDDWPHAYSRRRAAYPAPWLEEHKFWPHVGRIDNVWGDRNLICTCPSPDNYVDD